jgi:hypothetical protein
MSKYPKPPFDTKTYLIEDTFDPEKGATEKVLDLNDLDNNVLMSMAGSFPLAMDILSFRLEQENQKD